MPTVPAHYTYQWFQLTAGQDPTALNALGALGWHVVGNSMLPGGWLLLELVT